MTTPTPKTRPPARSMAVLTPFGRWHAARLKLLARLGATCKVAAKQ